MQIRVLLHLILWTLIFLQGSIQTFGLPSFTYKVGAPFCVLLLYFLTNPKKKNRKPFMRYILFLILISLISFLINNIPLFNLIYFLLYLTMPYFYFVIIINEQNEKVISRIKTFIVLFVLLQIPASITGFILYGQFEGNAGTLTNTSGSVSAVFPSIISAYCLAYYNERKKLIYVFVVLGMFLFGLIGEKRAITIFIPAVVLMVYTIPLIKFKRIFTTKTLSTLLVIALFSGAAFYGAVRLNPSLNKEGKIGGSFDYEYFTNYAQDYNEIGKHEDFSEMQRAEGFVYFINYMLNQPLEHLLFGDGAGKLISSRYSKNKNENLMLEFYNVRYGGRMGFIWVLMQIGYVGLIIYLSMFVTFSIRVWKLSYLNANTVAFLAMTVILFLDTLFYSKSFIRNFYIIGVYMFLFGLIVRENRRIIKLSKMK